MTNTGTSSTSGSGSGFFPLSGFGESFDEGVADVERHVELSNDVRDNRGVDPVVEES